MLNVYDYVANEKLFKKFFVDDLLFAQYKCLIKEDSVDYWSDRNYFVYILAGTKKWISKDRGYVLTAGDALFVRRGAYTAKRYDKEEFCALLIFLTDDFVKSVLEKYPLAGPPLPGADTEFDPIIPITVDDVLSAYFNSVMSYFPQRVSPPRELLRIKFEELILNVLNSESNRALATYLRKWHQTGKVSIQSVMENSFMYNMSLEEYARLCARSLSTFKADFYETYKMSPGKWLIETRIHYAKCLLETSDEPINDIAFKSGFKNTTHFVRVFKERYHVPPLQYRLKFQRELVTENPSA